MIIIYRKDPTKILAIGAHFDDIELGCGGSLYKLTQNKKKVYSLVLTESGWESPSNMKVRENKTALLEAKNASQILDIELVDIIRKTTCNLIYNDELIKSILKVIEDYEIDTVFTHWINDIHQDHFNASKATITACKHVPRVLMYCSNWYNSNIQFQSKFYIDISDEFDKKMEAISCYKSEMNRTQNKWQTWVTYQNEINGLKIGCKYAEDFEIIKYVI